MDGALVMKITIDLTDYEAASLRALLGWVAGANQNTGIHIDEIKEGRRLDPRISKFNTGDWVNQIRFKLPEYGYEWNPRLAPHEMYLTDDDYRQ